MNEKLFPSELHVMNVVWEQGSVSAKRIADVLSETIGWSKTTTYTVIKKCIEKGAITRTEPGFICTAAISKKEIRQKETVDLIDRLFGGKTDRLIASILEYGTLSPEEIRELRRMINEMK
ncbi:MAG: BlaI/MecI/CopY family transcriptional regulator [Clostridia bacterium]|nr:BlaI/MecI/CopY family transcriptional regulator [Clostridia bacterium]